MHQIASDHPNQVCSDSSPGLRIEVGYVNAVLVRGGLEERVGTKCRRNVDDGAEKQDTTFILPNIFLDAGSEATKMGTRQSE